jgi:F-type H+-transporting ATPase subunit alpha
MKEVSGSLRLDLAQFRELEAFATFGSELDKYAQAQLDRGYRLTELLKQNQGAPLSVAEQVVSIYAGTNGLLDGLPVGDVTKFLVEMIGYLKARHPELMDEITTSGKMPDKQSLTDAIVAFTGGFATSAKG